MKYIIRIIALPFFAGIVLVYQVVRLVATLVNFLRFGGESIAYVSNEQRKCINDIYWELVNSRTHLNGLFSVENAYHITEEELRKSVRGSCKITKI